MRRTLALALTLTIASHAVSAEPPKDFTNSIGMKFKLIPAGEFMMGSSESPEELAKAFGTKPKWFENERPQHKVRITKPFYLGVTQVTQEQYEKVMGENPSWFSKTGRKADKVKGMDTSNFPVEYVSWVDAVEFCKKLSAKEGHSYRLPTEAEWEYACRAGSTTRYCFGDDESQLVEYAWFSDTRGRTHPVAQKKPNAWGLYDMHGNLWEWCGDWYDREYYANSLIDDPTGPVAGSDRVGRGGGWNGHAWSCRSSARGGNDPANRDYALGFRVVAEPPASTPTEPAKEITNSIGMKFKLIPAGEFMMGNDSFFVESGKGVRYENERPQHKVRITKPFYLGVTEVTQEQYEKVMGKNPSWFSKNGKGADKVEEIDTSHFPVEMVSWNDAVEFCKRLSAKEGVTYQLPTEAEWEYACRAGSTTLFCFGNDAKRGRQNRPNRREAGQLVEYAWFQDNSDAHTHHVGQKESNAWGLHDMHGNVWEYCGDWYKADYFSESPTDDPTGPGTGSFRVLRGGSWGNPGTYCRSASRNGNRFGNRYLGFRVARGPFPTKPASQRPKPPATVGRRG